MYSDLSPREWEVAKLVARLHTNAEIAEILRISEHTVRFHVSNILGRLDVRSRREAVRRLFGEQST